MVLNTLKIVLSSLLLLHVLVAKTQNEYSFQIGLLKYNGGGDWYANKETSLKNLILFCNKNAHTNINPDQKIVEVGSPDLFQVPFVHMTGHGNVFFSAEDAKNLRTYLISGGFLHIDDNYGLDVFVRREMKKVFPELEFKELSGDTPLFTQYYIFQGIPKIHEHDGKPAQAFGLFYEGRLVCLYTYETDLGDGWEDADVHQDSEDIRNKALKMGVNILTFAFFQ